jgi:hexosaminidase
MKHIILLLTGMWVSIIVVAQPKSTSDIAIIPQPVTLETKNASFVVNNQTHVASGSKSADVQRIIRYFTEQVNGATGYTACCSC